MLASRLEASARFPRVAFEARHAVPAIEPLRTDVAGAIVRCPRGPVAGAGQREDVPMRVRGWREFEQAFLYPAQLDPNLPLQSPAAIRGYFDNGGEILWVVRVVSKAATASGLLPLRAAGAEGAVGSSPRGGQKVYARTLEVSATSPGPWANGLRVNLTLRQGGTPAGRPLADLRVIAQNGVTLEHLMALEPARLVEEVERSAYVRLRISVPTQPGVTPASREIRLSVDVKGGADDTPSFAEYERAARALAEEPEPAILFAPDAWTDLPPADVHRFYQSWADAAARGMDRIVLIDPPANTPGETLLQVANAARTPLSRTGPDPDPDPRLASALALYYPYVRVPVPATSTLRAVPPSGHVAGVISRLDRERGAHHTPANSEIVGAVDIDRDYDNAERAVLNNEGLNALRCARGRGVEVWGGRTLDRDRDRGFLAHRRLIHRLVRAMRRVAEPLVFDSNTAALRFSLVRALTTVLLEAYRAGALRGSRPEEAFQVVCDDGTNPPDAYDTGHCVAKVLLAPAAPMEFIQLTVSLSQDGSLEVFE